jgi:hypothetical protein
MANARNIKPDVMTDDRFFKKNPLLMILNIFLPTVADREGRLEDRPGSIHLRVLGLYPDCDANDLLNQLAEMQAIDRYEVHGIKVIQINNWFNLQNPHALQKDSQLPDKNGMFKVWQRKDGRIIKGAFKLTRYQTDIVKEDIKNSPDPYSPDNLTPDSVLLTTDSGLQTIDAAANDDATNLYTNVCRLFLERKILSFDVTDPSFVSLISSVPDIAYWTLGLSTAVAQKKPVVPCAAYVFSIVRNKWTERVSSKVIKFASASELPGHNTELDLIRRGNLLGITRDSLEHIPAFKVRIENLERSRKAG